MSISFPSFAADLSDDGTSISGDESWSLTVPARLAPGQSGRVTLEGSWSNTRQVSVTSDDSILLVSDLGDYQTLDIYFDGISLSGSNDSWVSDTETIGIESMNALFGTWVGEFYYSIEVFDFDPEQEEPADQEEFIDLYSETEEEPDNEENDNLTEDDLGDIEKNETNESGDESENIPEEEPSENDVVDDSMFNDEVDIQSVTQETPVEEQPETEDSVNTQEGGALL